MRIEDEARIAHEIEVGVAYAMLNATNEVHAWEGSMKVWAAAGGDLRVAGVALTEREIAMDAILNKAFVAMQETAEYKAWMNLEFNTLKF